MIYLSKTLQLCNSKIFAELCHGSEKISRSSTGWVKNGYLMIQVMLKPIIMSVWEKKMKVDFGAHLPFYLQHEECERISNFTCRRRTTARAPRHAKQAGCTGHSRRPSAKAPVLVHRCAAAVPAQLAPNTRLAARRRRNFWRVFSSRDFRGFKLTAQLQSYEDCLLAT